MLQFPAFIERQCRISQYMRFKRGFTAEDRNMCEWRSVRGSCCLDRSEQVYSEIYDTDVFVSTRSHRCQPCKALNLKDENAIHSCKK